MFQLPCPLEQGLKIKTRPAKARETKDKKHIIFKKI